MPSIKIFTFADKRPDFIPLQVATLRHFVDDDFEFTVFDNASSIVRSLRIRNKCKSLGVRWLRVAEQDHSNPTIACARPLQWSYDNLWKNDSGIVAVIDSDMFPVAKFSIENYLHGFNVAGTKQKRGHVIYLWNGILFFDMRTLPDKDSVDFMFGNVEGQRTDVGGHLYYWIRGNPELRIKHISHTGHIFSGNNNLICLPPEISQRYEDDFRFEIYAKSFLHYGRGSNWDAMPRDYHRRKTTLLKFWLDGAMTGRIKIPDYDYELPL